MAEFINTLKLKFQNGDILIKLIFINAIVFLIIGAINVIGWLFRLNLPDISHYLAVPADIELAIKHPWTFFTYMFVHANLLHIFLNMLIFYWFGRIFINYFGQRNMGGLYILGGLGGALLFIAAFNLIPAYSGMASLSTMVGASGAVMAIIFASAFYRPDQEITLFFFGRIKIIYIAIFLFIIDFFALRDSGNSGGHMAHIGGAAVGYLFAMQYKRGKNITNWLNRLIDMIVNLFKPRPKKLRVKKKNTHTETDQEYNQRRHRDAENIDHILDKIKASGYSSLTKEEKKQLFDASRK